MKKHLIKVLFLGILLTGIFYSCIEEVDLPIRVEKPRLVVDGLITNEKIKYTVKLSLTGKYPNSLSVPMELAIKGAKVIIIDKNGEITNLSQDLSQLGTYITVEPDFFGEIGNSYILEVTLPSGEIYSTKPEKMVAVPPISDLTFEFERNLNVNRPDGYQIYLNTNDPSDEQNFYRWSAYGYSRWESTGIPCAQFTSTICNNFCWVPTEYPQVQLYSDASINGNTIKKAPVYLSPIRGVGNHFIEVSQYSLSKNAYTFWSLYEEQRKRVGTIFDPQPAPIEGNLVNVNDPSDIALGYFGVSAVSRKKLTVPIDIKVRTSPELIPIGDCQSAFNNASLQRPKGWE